MSDYSPDAMKLQGFCVGRILRGLVWCHADQFAGRNPSYRKSLQFQRSGNMEPPRMLLLDFNPGAGLGQKLEGILELSHREIQFQQKSPELHGSTLCDRDLSEIISRFHPDLIFLILAPDLLMQADTLCHSIQRTSLDIPILVVIEKGEPEELFELLTLGVADFITPPLKAIDILPRVWRGLEGKRQTESPIGRLKEKLGLKQFVGENAAFLKEINQIPLVAMCDVSILISGETGTGKELCARAIHYLSPRAANPFIPVNCGAIPTELIENELFGHERGAFTSAFTSQCGLIHEADGGTVFLDEIDCLPPFAQVKLLRFLQEKEYRPLGSCKMCQVDVRIIAATNTNVGEMVREEKLRKDLYYRLNVIPLLLPPLRERLEDIPLLAHHFLSKYKAGLHRQVAAFSSDAMQKLLSYDWPGNVRELENVIQRAIVLCKHVIIQAADIILSQPEMIVHQESFQEAKARVIEQFERQYIQHLLLLHAGNITQAARAAQKNRRAFWQLIQKHHLNVQQFKSGAF